MSSPVGTLKRIAIHGLIIAVAGIALLWGNTLARQRLQFSRGEEALSRGDFVAVTSGLKAGERVIVEGSGKVRPGQSVRVVDAKPFAGNAASAAPAPTNVAAK